MYVIQTDKNPSLECVRNKDSIDGMNDLYARDIYGKKKKKKKKEFTFDLKYLHDAL